MVLSWNSIGTLLEFHWLIDCLNVTLCPVTNITCIFGMWAYYRMMNEHFFVLDWPAELHFKVLAHKSNISKTCHSPRHIILTLSPSLLLLLNPKCLAEKQHNNLNIRFDQAGDWTHGLPHSGWAGWSLRQSAQIP